MKRGGVAVLGRLGLLIVHLYQDREQSLGVSVAELRLCLRESRIIGGFIGIVRCSRGVERDEQSRERVVIF